MVHFNRKKNNGTRKSRAQQKSLSPKWNLGAQVVALPEETLSPF
jgi:hypothetical protein